MFRLNRPSKKLLLNFHCFYFDDFLTSFAKNVIKKPPVFLLLSKICMNYYFPTKIWCLWAETRFCCLFSLNQKIVAMFHLMIPIKYIAVFPFHENSRRIKQSFLNNWTSNMVSHFFRIPNFSCLYVVFAKNFMKKPSFFKMNF